jgi:hypothetical protein
MPMPDDDPAIREMESIIEEEKQHAAQRDAKLRSVLDRMREFVKRSKGPKEYGADESA